jgi:hypothetical protein
MAKKVDLGSLFLSVGICEVGFSLCYLLLDIAGNTAALISPVLCEIHSKYVVVKNNVVSPHRKTLI